ncbi:hypothetical protein, partial [Actinoallomurus sp. NPDC050550]|uniref:hypothetical protein n=1 Tax=Actinoallomurus sp. NPDC050550 TaxID=3154937 RepID=UPI0034050D6A
MSESHEVSASGVPDSLVSEALKDTEFANRHPELEAYLSRRNKNVDHDMNAPLGRWQEKVVIFGSREHPVNVRLRHEPTIPNRLIDATVANVRLAVSRVQAAGFPVPDLKIYMPKYSKSLRLEVVEAFTPAGEPYKHLQVSIVEDKASAVAMAFTHRYALAVSIQPPGMSDDERMPIYSDVGPQDMPTIIDEESVAIVVHELGHLLHGVRYVYPLAANVAMRDTTLSDLFGYVSEYARSGGNPAEFVAEFFVRWVYGLIPGNDPIFGRLGEVYRDFGGPMPVRARAGFPALPLNSRKKRRLVALVNGKLRERGAGFAAAESHIDAVYASAPEIHVLVMEEKARRIADVLQSAQSVALMPPQVPAQGWSWPSGPGAGGSGAWSGSGYGPGYFGYSGGYNLSFRADTSLSMIVGLG